MGMKPVRVLQIMGIVNSGGVEAVIRNYYMHIDKTKVQFDFVVHQGANRQYVDEVKSLGAKVYEVTPYTKNVFRFTYEIYKIIKEGNYKIVHSNMNSLSVFPLLAAYLAGAKVRILHNHTTDNKAEGLRTTLKRTLRPFAKMFANRYWACSKLAAEWMYGKQAIEQGKVTVINNAIDLDKFAFDKEKRTKLRKKLRLEGKFVIGHIGRFMKQKNHEFLIDIFAEVAKQKENAVLLLIGEGSLMDGIKKKASKLGLQDKVKFLGARNDVADLYNVMDEFVLPSLYEGLPVVGVESQANGLPFLCSDNVTEEVVLSSVLKRLSLKAGAKEWVKEVLEIASVGRKDTKTELVKAGFDIKVESKKLEELYVLSDKNKDGKVIINGMV